MIDFTRNTLPRIDREPFHPPLILAPAGCPGHYPESARWATRKCLICGEPIGYGVPFWFAAELHPEFTTSTTRRVRHAACDGWPGTITIVTR